MENTKQTMCTPDNHKSNQHFLHAKITTLTNRIYIHTPNIHEKTTNQLHLNAFHT